MAGRSRSRGALEANCCLRHRRAQVRRCGAAGPTLRRCEYSVTGQGGSTIGGRAEQVRTSPSAFPMPIDGDRGSRSLWLERQERWADGLTIVPPIGRQGARGPTIATGCEVEHRAVLAGRPRSRSSKACCIDSTSARSHPATASACSDELRRRGPRCPSTGRSRTIPSGVPEGGIPVIRYSPEWFERLRTAKYFLTNMYQPLYHPKPHGQDNHPDLPRLPVQGDGPSALGQNLRFSKTADSTSFDERTRAWDHLVSPGRLCDSSADPRLRLRRETC